MKKCKLLLLALLILISCGSISACSSESEPKPTESTAPSQEYLEKDVMPLAEKFTAALVETDYTTLFDCYAMNWGEVMKSMLSSDDMKEAFEFYGVSDLEGFYKLQHKEAVSKLKNNYGDDYKLDVSAEKCDEITGTDMSSFIENCKIEADSYAKNYDVESKDLLDTDKISKVVKVTLKCSISGSKTSDEETKVLYSVLIDGKWKIIDDIEV